METTKQLIHLLHCLHEADFVKQMADLNVVNHFRVLSFFVPCQSPHALTHLPSPHCQPHQLHNSSGVDGAQVPQVLEGCPGQTFQVSRLVTHLHAATAYASDVLLQPYLSSWDELVRWDHQIKWEGSDSDEFTAIRKYKVIRFMADLDSVR